MGSSRISDSRISESSGQRPCQQPVRKQCVPLATAPLPATAQTENPLPLHECQNQQSSAQKEMDRANQRAAPKDSPLKAETPALEEVCPAGAAKEIDVVVKKPSSTTPVWASRTAPPNTCALEEQPFPAEVSSPNARAKGRPMTNLQEKLKAGTASINSPKKSAQQISKDGAPLNPKLPREALQGKHYGMEQENRVLEDIEAREQRLRDKLREVEQENAALKLKFSEVQGQLSIVVSERDELREGKEQAEHMLRAAMEHWEKDQRRLVELEKRLKEHHEELPGRNMGALGDKLASLKATSLRIG